MRYTVHIICILKYGSKHFPQQPGRTVHSVSSWKKHWSGSVFFTSNLKGFFTSCLKKTTTNKQKIYILTPSTPKPGWPSMFFGFFCHLLWIWQFLSLCETCHFSTRTHKIFRSTNTEIALVSSELLLVVCFLLLLLCVLLLLFFGGGEYFFRFVFFLLDFFSQWSVT